MTIEKFIERHKIEFSFQVAPENPNMDDMPSGSNHYHCTLKVGGRTMTTYFSMGPAFRVWKTTAIPSLCGGFGKPKDYKSGQRVAFGPAFRVSEYDRQAREAWSIPQPPKLAEVLECLVSDAQGLEGASTFEEWAEEYGMDTDSRKAINTYRATMKQSDKLRKLLGAADYRVLLEEVERL